MESALSMTPSSNAAETIHLPERSFDEALEASRVMPHPERGVTLRNGASARIRAIRPDDETRLMALCRRLSPRTVYQRFFSVRRLLPEEAHAFANVDHCRSARSSGDGRSFSRVKEVNAHDWAIPRRLCRRADLSLRPGADRQGANQDIRRRVRSPAVPSRRGSRARHDIRGVAASGWH